MLSYALGQFFLKLSVGILPWITLIHVEDIGKSFFRLLVFLSFASAVLTLVLSFSADNWVLMAFIAALWVLFLMIKSSKSTKLEYWVMPCFLAGAVVLKWQNLVLLKGYSLASFISVFLGALLSGSALVAMVLGHWYLIRSQLSFHYLIRATAIFMGLVLLRLLFGGYVLLTLSETGRHLLMGKVGEIMLITRFLWGGLLPLFFLYFAYQCAKIHSNRSTTGILYFTTASIFMGELMSDYIFRLTGIGV
jgi:hypothetical protein